VPADQVIIADFFAASRLRDLTALSKYSTTVFEPLQQGIVTDFEIKTITKPRLDGEFLFKEVTVDAPVRTSDGRTVEKMLVLVLRRRMALTDTRPLYGGWQIVAVHE
jgi:hypothetical protein